MKIGIIVHSQTNNTYSVAQRLQEKLIEEDNEVELKRVRWWVVINRRVKIFRLKIRRR